MPIALSTVVKREAWAVAEARGKLVGVDDEQTLEALDDGRHCASVEECSERFEDLARAAEALRRLKPQEVTALVLNAQGLLYQEIAERQDGLHEGLLSSRTAACSTASTTSFRRSTFNVAGNGCSMSTTALDEASRRR